LPLRRNHTDSDESEQTFGITSSKWYDVLVQAVATLSEVDELFDDAAGHLNAQHARLVSAAAWMLDHVDEWQGDGVWTPEAYVAWRTGVSRSTATKVVNIARRVGEFPHCVATMQRGELSLDQMEPIVRHAPGWADRQMSGLATRLTTTQISKVAREYPWQSTDQGCSAESANAAPDIESHPDTAVESDETNSGGSAPSDEATAAAAESTAEVPSASEPSDEAWFGWDDRGRFRLQVNVGADSGMIIEAALNECRDHVFHTRTDTNSSTTIDAVLEMAGRSIDAVESPDRRNRFRVNVHVDSSSGVVTDSRGRSVPNGPAERITCDAVLSPIAFRNGVPVSVGRSQHIVPDRTRRLVEHRDGGCRVPGCFGDRFVEVHHIVHWSMGGPTDTSNLICLCSKHHRLHHQGRLGLCGDADRPPDTVGAVEFLDRHGVKIRSSGASPTPPGRPPPAIEGHWEHPLGERLELRWLYFNDDPNRPSPVAAT
jgi:hypothetical protein